MYKKYITKFNKWMCIKGSFIGVVLCSTLFSLVVNSPLFIFVCFVALLLNSSLLIQFLIYVIELQLKEYPVEACKLALLVLDLSNNSLSGLPPELGKVTEFCYLISLACYAYV